MATKRAPDVPDLSNDVISVLLGGWGAEPPPSEERTHGFGGGYAELDRHSKERLDKPTTFDQTTASMC